MSKQIIQELENYCQEAVKEMKLGGGFISSEKAGAAHAAWLLHRFGTIDRSAIPPFEITALSFDKEMLQKLLDITDCRGVRVYFCRSKSNIAGIVKEHDDIFLMPYKINNDGFSTEDIASIRHHIQNPTPIDHTKPDGGGQESLNAPTQDNMILNTSRPCPNYCSTT